MQHFELGHLIEIAAQVLDVDRATARGMMKIPFAESTLAAPFAGYSDFEKYPTFNEKVGVPATDWRATMSSPMAISAPRSSP